MKRIMAMVALAAMGAGAWAAELKLSLQAYTFRDRSFVETVETAARLGYENLEAYPGQRLGGDMKGTTDYRSISPEALAQLKAFLAKAPVKVVSYGVTGAGNDQEWEKLMAFCRELGIGQVQVEVGIAQDNLARAERYAKDSGVRVSLHNHRQPAGRPENVLKALEGFGPMIGAGCDIGHWQNAGVDPVAGVKLLKGKFHCIHAIDSSGPSAGNKDVALGSGVVDFVAILDALKANETGTVYVTVEDERQYEGLEADVAESARWFKAWAAGCLARRALDAAEGWSPVKWNKAAFESGVWKMGVDGVMTATKDDAIWSDASYENFELDFDYKLDPAANSGVIIYAEDTKNWIPNAIEIQLLDDNHERWNKDGPHLKNASLYGHVAPVATPAKPAGQWNHMNIKAVGQQITVTVNGVLALDYSLAKLTDGKVTPEGYKIPGHLPRPWSTIRTSGPIGLQGKHGGALPYFRNVRIRQVK